MQPVLAKGERLTFPSHLNMRNRLASRGSTLLFSDAFVDVGLDYVSLGCVKLRYDTLRQQRLCWYGLDWFGLG